MYLFSKIKSKKIQLNPWISLFLLFFFSLGTTFFLFWVAPGPIIGFLKELATAPSLFFLNYIPILLLMLLIFFLTNNSSFSVWLTAALFAILGIANRLKISMRQDPLLPTDLTLVRETTAVLNTFDTSSLILIFCLLTAMVIVILITAIFFRCKKVKPLVRILGCVATIAIEIGRASCRERV